MTSVAQSPAQLRGAIRTILDCLQSLNPKFALMSTPELVRLGVDILSMSAFMDRLLEEVKKAIRTRVEPELRGRESTTLSGHGCHSVVTTQKPVPVLRRGTDIETLKEVLGGFFPLIFSSELVYQIRPDFREILPQLAADQVALLVKAVDVPDSKLRVSFVKET